MVLVTHQGRVGRNEEQDRGHCVLHVAMQGVEAMSKQMATMRQVRGRHAHDM